MQRQDSPAPISQGPYFTATYAYPGNLLPYAVWHVVPEARIANDRVREVDRFSRQSSAEHAARMANLGAEINWHGTTSLRIDGAVVTRAAQRCCCESALCDHESACERPADASLRMDYVVHTCRACAESMRATGGAEHIHTVSV